jgi:hypothetical protein
MSDERDRIAERLRRIRDGVRERSLLEPRSDLPPAKPPATPRAVPPEEVPAEDPPPPRPDATAVNDLWKAEGRAPGGLRGFFARLLERVQGEKTQAQRAFNARQVQLDNELLDYVDARLEGTHRHYDRVLGQYGRHLTEADERHMILQEELVAHVHDLVKRIDLVLSGSERGRLGLEVQIREIRERLKKLEALVSRE